MRVFCVFFCFFGAKIWPAAAGTGELARDLRGQTPSLLSGPDPCLRKRHIGATNEPAFFFLKSKFPHAAQIGPPQLGPGWAIGLGGGGLLGWFPAQ